MKNSITNSIVYNKNGEKAGEITLPESIFGIKWNADLVYQVVHAMQANKRAPTAHTKDRSEVSGGGRKPWKQKGTGRARHGSTRSPIWRKGGTTFGPRNERDYSQKINKKMRTKALYMVLAQKMKDGEIVFLDELNFSKPKTKDAKTAIISLSKVKGLEKLTTKKKNTAYIGLSNFDENVVKSFRNFGNISVDALKNINPVEALAHKFLVIEKPEEAFAFLEGKVKIKNGKN